MIVAEADRRAQVAVLTRINLDDFQAAMGLDDSHCAAPLLRASLARPARRFAELMAAFDAATAEVGLAEASRRALRSYIADLEIFGAERIPAGPFLALANHPGMTDTLALFCALQRDDLKIIALRRPFLEALPSVTDHLLFVDEDGTSSWTLARQAASFLRRGGALLTFPAGRIEPDPDLSTEASAALSSWTDSAGSLIRLSGDTPILPVLVRGVVWARAARHPLTVLRRDTQDRERLGAALQILAQMLWRLRPVKVRVCVGRPVVLSKSGRSDRATIHRAVLAELRHLIEQAPSGPGVSLL